MFYDFVKMPNSTKKDAKKISLEQSQRSNPFHIDWAFTKRSICKAYRQSEFSSLSVFIFNANPNRYICKIGHGPRKSPLFRLLERNELSSPTDKSFHVVNKIWMNNFSSRIYCLARDHIELYVPLRVDEPPLESLHC